MPDIWGSANSSLCLSLLPLSDIHVCMRVWHMIMQLASVQVQMRPYNLDNAKSIRLLDPSDIDQLVTIRGMVTRTSAIIPNLR